MPKALEAVCARAMAARPEDRYQSARALAADVERWLADEPVSAYRDPPRERLRRWAKSHRPLVTAEENSARMVQDLVSRVFDGSAAALVLNVLDQSELDADELKTLRKLIDRKARAEARKPNQET